MSTSACKRFFLPRWALPGAAGCAVAALVYQRFGHGVYSAAMTLCFLPPVGYGLCGALLRRWGHGIAPLWGDRLLGAGAATLALGMFLQGVMEIAGAESAYPGWMMALGGLEGLAGLLVSAKGARRAARPAARPAPPAPPALPAQAAQRRPPSTYLHKEEKPWPFK